MLYSSRVRPLHGLVVWVLAVLCGLAIFFLTPTRQAPEWVQWLLNAYPHARAFALWLPTGFPFAHDTCGEKNAIVYGPVLIIGW